MSSVTNTLIPEILHVGDDYVRTTKYVTNAKLTAYIWGNGEPFRVLIYSPCMITFPYYSKHSNCSWNRHCNQRINEPVFFIKILPMQRICEKPKLQLVLKQIFWEFFLWNFSENFTPNFFSFIIISFEFTSRIIELQLPQPVCSSQSSDSWALCNSSGECFVLCVCLRLNWAQGNTFIQFKVSYKTNPSGKS
jgi:hypothetical protein